MKAESKPAVHTATDPATKAAKAIAKSVDEQLAAAGMTQVSGSRFVSECAADFAPMIREAYAPLTTSHAALVAALRALADTSYSVLADCDECTPIVPCEAHKTLWFDCRAAESALALAEEQ